MVVPGEKAELVKNAEKEVVAVEGQYQDGAITHGERYNKIIEIWSPTRRRGSDASRPLAWCATPPLRRGLMPPPRSWWPRPKPRPLG